MLVILSHAVILKIILLLKVNADIVSIEDYAFFLCSLYRWGIFLFRYIFYHCFVLVYGM